MTNTNTTIRVVRGPDGVPICANDLPPDHTVRWVKRNKAIVAAAVRGGLLSPEDAATRYRLSEGELESWIAAIASNALAGAQVRLRH